MGGPPPPHFGGPMGGPPPGAFFGGGPPSGAPGMAAAAAAAAGKKVGVVRQAAGKRWVDTTLVEWPENDFRIFVGNLGNEVSCFEEGKQRGCLGHAARGPGAWYQRWPGSTGRSADCSQAEPRSRAAPPLVFLR